MFRECSTSNANDFESANPGAALLCRPLGAVFPDGVFTEAFSGLSVDQLVRGLVSARDSANLRAVRTAVAISIV